MSRQAVSKHLEVLERVGLVHAERHGRERRYTASASPAVEANEWLAAYRQQWDESFDRLDEYLQTLGKEPGT